MKYFLIGISLLATLACTTHPHSEGREAYIEVIEKHSAGDKQFAGLYHNFEFRATLLTEDVSQAIHKRMNKFYAWSDQEDQAKLTERLSELQSKTKIFLSFFTSEKKNDNLANKNSIWKVYLITGGQRYEGHPSKANENLEEAIALFPYHSHWATAYFVEFPIPTSQVENQDLRLLITGPMGRREVRFSF